MATLTIHDETVSGVKSCALELELPGGTIRARELIASRVEEEVRRFNAQATEVFHGLVQPSGSERLLNGYKLRTPRRIQPRPQVERALNAFTRNGFFLLVNDRQIENLDEEIAIGLNTQVAFVKLVPLVGG